MNDDRFTILTNNYYVNKFYYELFVTYVNVMKKYIINYELSIYDNDDYRKFIMIHLSGIDAYDTNGIDVYDTLDVDAILKKYPYIVDLYNLYTKKFYKINLYYYINHLYPIYQLDDINFLLRKEKLKHLMK